MAGKVFKSRRIPVIRDWSAGKDAVFQKETWRELGRTALVSSALQRLIDRCARLRNRSGIERGVFLEKRRKVEEEVEGEEF